MRKILFAIAIALVSGCGGMYAADPVGVGFDANELKLSPCACAQIKLKPGLPEFMTV